MMDSSEKQRIHDDLNLTLSVSDSLEQRLNRRRISAVNQVEKKHSIWRYLHVAERWNDVQVRAFAMGSLASIISFTVLFSSLHKTDNNLYFENIELLSASETLPILEQDVEFYLWLAEQDL